MKKLLFLLSTMPFLSSANPIEDDHALLMKVTTYRHAGLSEEKSLEDFLKSNSAATANEKKQFLMAYRISQAFDLKMPCDIHSSTQKLFAKQS